MKVWKRISAIARKRKLETDKERIERKRREEKRLKVRARTNALTPDGFDPKMRAKLHAAAQRAEEDPRAKRLVERAELSKRVEQLRRTTGIGNVSPPIFAGEPIEPSKVPPRVAELVKEDRAKKAAEAELPRQDSPIVAKTVDKKPRINKA